MNLFRISIFGFRVLINQGMEKGLSKHQAKELLKEHGKNVIRSEDKSSAVKIFLEQFPTLINGILTIAALLAFILKDFLDGGFILAIVILNAVLGFVQEYRAQKSLEKLKQYTSPTARVIRDGKEQQLPAEDIVPGDLIIVAEGDRIPADGILIETTHLEVDESILTGESLAVIKNIAESVFLGTLATKGHGLFRVDKTGMKTNFGQIANTLENIQEEKTPLQKNLNGLGRMLAFMALGIGFLIIPIGMFQNQDIIPLILVGATIGLAAIPEGLPAVVTIAFAIGTHRMAKRNAIVRKMAAVETLGAIQVILVDKTGTITKNAMAVKKYWLKNKEHMPLLIESCILGNTASLIEKGNGRDYEIVGDQTDGALLVWAKEQKGAPIPTDSHVIDEYVFDSESKTITTVWQRNAKEYVFVRGAPETIIANSTLTEEEKMSATKRVNDAASEGLRVIGFGVKIEKHGKHQTRKQLEKGITFLGLIALYDPPRSEIKEAVAKARAAGIHVSMVTGDNEMTALAIAKEVGLIEKDEDVVTSEELEKLTDEELSSIIFKTRIFARSKPDQKLRIATLLQKQGYVVGVTGDGINDVLALKKADVGVAMGKGGTDVAKEASDIILADNNFATLIRAIEEGRIIYKNIMNAIVYLISGNLAEISLVFFANLLHMPFPLLPTQILWINLVTDSLPAIALATGSKDPTVLSHKPRDPKSPILNRQRSTLICLVGFGLSGFLLVIYHFLLQSMPETNARTIIFNLLIYLHLLLVIGLGWHSLKKGNKFIIFTIVFIALLQLTITYVPFFREIFHLAI